MSSHVIKADDQIIYFCQTFCLRPSLLCNGYWSTYLADLVGDGGDLLGAAALLGGRKSCDSGTGGIRF